MKLLLSSLLLIFVSISAQASDSLRLSQEAIYCVKSYENAKDAEFFQARKINCNYSYDSDKLKEKAVTVSGYAIYLQHEDNGTKYFLKAPIDNDVSGDSYLIVEKNGVLKGYRVALVNGKQVRPHLRKLGKLSGNLLKAKLKVSDTINRYLK